jgi:hypothetical protein
LNRLCFTDDDMEIVAYYLLVNNKVSHVVFICYTLQKEGTFGMTYFNYEMVLLK